MSSELSLLVELYNPLYLFPIVGVVFTALVVYTFGFKSSTQPPTEVVEALNDKHYKSQKTSHETVKKKKQIQKTSSPKTELKSQPNGHISSESNRASTEKKVEKTPKKAAVEPAPKAETPKADKATKKQKKNKKVQEINDVEVDDKDSGEWVEHISKKERKNRKQKEEQRLLESVSDAQSGSRGAHGSGKGEKKEK